MTAEQLHVQVPALFHQALTSTPFVTTPFAFLTVPLIVPTACAGAGAAAPTSRAATRMHMLIANRYRARGKRRLWREAETDPALESLVERISLPPTGSC